MTLCPLHSYTAGALECTAANLTLQPHRKLKLVLPAVGHRKFKRVLPAVGSSKSFSKLLKVTTYLPGGRLALAILTELNLSLCVRYRAGGTSSTSVEPACSIAPAKCTGIYWAGAKALSCGILCWPQLSAFRSSLSRLDWMGYCQVDYSKLIAHARCPL